MVCITLYGTFFPKLIFTQFRDSHLSDHHHCFAIIAAQDERLPVLPLLSFGGKADVNFISVFTIIGCFLIAYESAFPCESRHANTCRGHLE